MLTDPTTHPDADLDADTHGADDADTHGTLDTDTDGAPAAAPCTDAGGAADADVADPASCGPADPAGPAVASGSLGRPESGGVPAPQPRRGGEVRVGLATLMHRDERPGEIPGWGPVIADAARAMASRQHRAEWRFAVTDATGHLVLSGLTRRRPRGVGDTARECRGGIVELHVPAALLVELAAASESSGPWAAVVADIAGQYARRHRHQRMLDARPDDRFANALLRRHVQVRDRTCVAPGCRRPARRCDQDHPRPRARRSHRHR